MSSDNKTGANPVNRVIGSLINQAKGLRDFFYNKRRQSYLARLQERGLRMGEKVEIAGDFFFDPSHCYLITIGNRVTFAPGIRIVAHDASSFRSLGFTRLGRVVIGDDSFIGDSVIVLPGVEIGKNCIVGAGSVVAKDIPAGSVAAGNPAKVICSTEDLIEKRKSEKEQSISFDSSYRMSKLTEAKRQEILKAVADGFAYLE